MNQEEFKLTIIKQFSEHGFEAKAAMFRDDMNVEPDWKQYEKRILFLVNEFDLSFLVESIETKRDVRFAVTFMDINTDVNVDGDISIQSFGESFSRKACIETIDFVDGNAVFCLNVIDLVVKDHCFKIAKTERMLATTYDIENSVFLDEANLQPLCVKWESVMYSCHEHYVRYRFKIEDIQAFKSFTKTHKLSKYSSKLFYDALLGAGKFDDDKPTLRDIACELDYEAFTNEDGYEDR